MLEDEALCNKCGKPNKKDTRYCIHCGALFEPTSPQFTADTGRITETSSSMPPTKIPEKSKFSFKETKIGYKVLIYFVIVAIVNSILSAIVVFGFNFTPASYFPIFFGVFLLSMFIVGVFWGASKADAVEAIGTCGAIVLACIAIAILIPIWIIVVLGPIVGAIAAEIGEAISNAINNFFTDLFADIEIPGFEPILFISLFLVLSMFIIYKFHLILKKQ